MSDQAVLDILMPTGTNGFPQFTVNNGVPEVAISYGGLAQDFVLYNAGGKSLFNIGDSFTILSFGLIMPLSFQIGRRLFTGLYPYITFSINAHGISNNTYSLKELGNAQELFYVMENYDTPLDMFIDVMNQNSQSNVPYYLGKEPFRLRFSSPSMVSAKTFVSMTGVPSSLNSTVQLITPYIKILHNFPLA